MSGFDQSTALKHKEHFPKIQRELGIDFDNMLFFDDENQNITNVLILFTL